MVSQDGNKWVALRDGLHPEPQWGESFIYADHLPKDVLGAKELFVKIVMQTGDATEGSYAAAQHGWDRGRRTAPFELRVDLMK